MNETEELLVHYLTPRQLAIVVSHWEMYLKVKEDYVKNIVVRIFRFKYSRE